MYRVVIAIFSSTTLSPAGTLTIVSVGSTVTGGCSFEVVTPVLG